MYSVPEKKEHTDYALDSASKLLEFYNKFFDIDYPLKKLGEHTLKLTCFPHKTCFLSLSDYYFLPSLVIIILLLYLTGTVHINNICENKQKRLIYICSPWLAMLTLRTKSLDIQSRVKAVKTMHIQTVHALNKDRKDR